MKLGPHCVVGTVVGFSLVPLSPFFSWTRGPWSTSRCGHGPSSAPKHVSWISFWRGPHAADAAIEKEWLIDI